jgi:hypothetical protein
LLASALRKRPAPTRDAPSKREYVEHTIMTKAIWASLVLGTSRARGR